MAITPIALFPLSFAGDDVRRLLETHSSEGKTTVVVVVALEGVVEWLEVEVLVEPFEAPDVELVDCDPDELAEVAVVEVEPDDPDSDGLSVPPVARCTPLQAPSSRAAIPMNRRIVRRLIRPRRDVGQVVCD